MHSWACARTYLYTYDGIPYEMIMYAVLHA
jgi:hypothetical protein